MTLPPETRAALWLHLVDGEGFAEVADTLDLSPAAVERLIRDGQRELRQFAMGCGLFLPPSVHVETLLRQLPERVAAAKTLADMGSIRAVPIFIDMIRKDEREEVSITRLRFEADGWVNEIRSKIFMQDPFSLMGADKRYTITLHLTPILRGLLKAGPQAMPFIERALAEKAEARRVPNALKILKTILEKEGSNLEIESGQDLRVATS